MAEKETLVEWLLYTANQLEHESPHPLQLSPIRYRIYLNRSPGVYYPVH